MSIPVDLAALGEALSRHDTAYLLLSGEDRPHVSEIFPRLVDGIIVVAEPTGTARRVLPGHPALTMMLPPKEKAGYTLIIDGDGRIDDQGQLRILPQHAVLHRSAAHGPQHESDCGGDCRPIGG